jgi:hypothetical protein
MTLQLIVYFATGYRVRFTYATREEADARRAELLAGLAGAWTSWELVDGLGELLASS